MHYIHIEANLQAIHLLLDRVADLLKSHLGLAFYIRFTAVWQKGFCSNIVDEQVQQPAFSNYSSRNKAQAAARKGPNQ